MLIRAWGFMSGPAGEVELRAAAIILSRIHAQENHEWTRIHTNGTVGFALYHRSRQPPLVTDRHL